LFTIALALGFGHDARMTKRDAAPPIREQDVRGLKYFDQLAPLLERLHEVGCQRDAAAKRILHFDQYCLLILLFLFSPLIKSLRSLQQASELKNAQRKLGCPRTSLGSLSESVSVFDPQRLQEIIAELGAQLEPLGRDPRLKDMGHTVTLVDATLLSALPRMAEASFLKSHAGSGLVKWRLHTHFEVDRHVPARIDVTRAGGGDCDERAVLERTIESDHLYVMDRGYAKFTLFNRVVAAGSSYVCRIRDNSAYDIVEERPLTDADREQRVRQDAIVTLGEGSAKSARPDHTVRLITIQCQPHRKQGRSQRYARQGSTGPACDGVLRLATNRLDVPAEVIALLYHYRWTIEIFFRFFKQILGCRHLLSHSRHGIEIQTYCAIIACMLISLWTGKKPTLRTYEMICWYLMGVADLEELQAHIERLKKHTV
jgi:Transposase DDE domain